MSKSKAGPDYIPLAMMNAYAYCPRRFYYEQVLGEMVVNAEVLEGQLLHERTDRPGQLSREDKLQWRRVYVCAPRLGLSGFCDLVEAVGVGPGESEAKLVELARAGRLYPVEYKKGKLGRWLSDHVQLCAQALALEESLGLEEGTIGQGYVFYFGSARREEVTLDQALRGKTLALLAEARQVAELPQPPPPITNRAKCRDCSLEPICLPREVREFETKLKQTKKTEKGGRDEDGGGISDFADRGAGSGGRV